MLNMQEQKRIHKRHRHSSHLSSSTVTVHHDSKSNAFVAASPMLNAIASAQCSAYFLHRYDLNDYAVNTLKNTVDAAVSRTQSKGLKVKLSLPDEGLIVENLTDPNLSWMFKQSELLYFWPDPFYSKIIVVISYNRQTPYSASIFRLRGDQSVQRFLQRAQHFFANLSRTSLIEKSSTIERRTTRSKRDKSERSKKTSQSLRPTPIRLVTRTEFDPGQTSIENSISSIYHRRTYSETSDSNSRPVTTNPTSVSAEYVADLVRELKELRQEIAALKMESRVTPVRSTSTSPIQFFENNSNKTTEEDEISAPVTNSPISLPIEEESLIRSSSPKTEREPEPIETVSFRSIVENTKDPPEHIYENVPILIQMKSSSSPYYNVPKAQGNSSLDSYVYLKMDDPSKSKFQSQSSPSINSQTRLSLLLSTDSNNAPNDQYRPPNQILFANHLTNPLFHFDKQLLANTVANQFGIDLQSPYLQQLISNQHLFVAHKRTYANMIWQMTPEEIRTLCSSPTNISAEIETTTNPTTRSILKTPGLFRSLAKRSRITWNTTIERRFDC